MGGTKRAGRKRGGQPNSLMELAEAAAQAAQTGGSSEGPEGSAEPDLNGKSRPLSYCLLAHFAHVDRESSHRSPAK